MAALLMTSALALSSPAAAQEDAVEAVGDAVSGALSGWSGTASLGASSTTGNSKSSNVNASLRIAKTSGRWEHLVFGSIFKGQSSLVIEQTDAAGNPVLADDGNPQLILVNGDNSDRFALGYQPKFYYTDRTYFFGLFDWEQDEPSNIDTATRQVIGVGHRFFSNSTGSLSAELGFGNKTTDLVTGNNVDGGIGYLGVNYLRNISENAIFNADLRSDFGSDNTFVEIGLGLSIKVSQRLAFKIAHFTRSNTDLSAGDSPLNSDSDSVTTLNLVFDI